MMMNNYHTLYPETFTLGNGLIFTLSNIEDIPWRDSDDDTKHQIERLYGLRSSNKIMVSTFEQIPDIDRAKIIASMFADKWQKLWRVFNIEYNPLHAYVMNESEQRHKEFDETNKMTYGRTTNTTGTDTGTVVDKIDETVNSTANVYGFNSTEPVPSNTGNENTDNETTQTRNLSNSTNTINSGDDNEVKGGTSDENSTLSKNGNIGYFSPQSLLKQDIELWAKPYFEIVFSDIDSLIMLQVY